MSDRMVYFFGNGKADGDASMRELLGGKGANLAEMTNMGIPVPPGFTITTECCAFFSEHKRWPDGLEEQVREAMARLEETLSRRFGDPEDPLLVSVRSGAAVSMPGMMDTVLNLGLNRRSVEGLAAKSGNPRFAWDSYRRFIHMFGDVVCGVDHDAFESIMEALKKEKGAATDADLDAGAMKELAGRYLELFERETGEVFPEDPFDQLRRAIDAVFQSWNNDRAVSYRRLNDIRGIIGTAVNVQAMVFGNFGANSGTGVCFTRDPGTGENVFYGEFLQNAQGEDVVAGTRTAAKIDEIKQVIPGIYEQLFAIAKRLENHYREMQDIEFTVQDGTLFILQTRSGKRTGKAAVRIAVEMVAEGLIDEDTAVLRVDPGQLDQLLHPDFAYKYDKSMNKPPVLAKGLAASPGAAIGRICFDADAAVEQAARGEPVILVRQETSPEDIEGMHVSRGILTQRGGMTSHAAVVARGMGTPCVAGAEALRIDERAKTLVVTVKVATDSGEKTEERILREGDYLSIDGSTGEVFEGEQPTVEPKLTDEYYTLMGWADARRRMRVRTNADTPADCAQAREYGAEGIGLCRTEHMFFEEDRIVAVRRMILASTPEERKAALASLLPLQRGDFEGIFRAMDGLPVTIRLLDPPLHEFLPMTAEAQRAMAEAMGVEVEVVRKKVEDLRELNPMLGHRGCRLGLTHPEIYEMQVKAIVEAAAAVAKAGVKVIPEIMHPLVGIRHELRELRALTLRIIDEVRRETGFDGEILVGTMIEVPRAALTADEIAEHADFFSFGTNDLTQMTYGFSRDDTGPILAHYQELGILESDPFASLDTAGVGQLVKAAVEKGRSVKPDLKCGICGEHGGDPKSIGFCEQVGLDYVSCSPFRVPIARLAAAQAAMRARR